MNRDTARAIEQQALALLAPMESDGQLKVAVKGGTIGKTFVNLKIEFAEVGEDGVAESREAADFKALAKFYGLQRRRLGKAVRQPWRVLRNRGPQAQEPQVSYLGAEPPWQGLQIPGRKRQAGPGAGDGRHTIIASEPDKSSAS